MGLLDSILGNVLGNLGNSGNMGGLRPQGNGGGGLGSSLGRLGGNVVVSALVAMAFQMLQRNGGISGVLDKLRQSGLGNHAQSWVSTGENMPISAGDLEQALGSGQLAELASHFGMSPQEASTGLAQVLPEVVNQMTPAGQVPANDLDMISDALSQLKPR